MSRTVLNGILLLACLTLLMVISGCGGDRGGNGSAASSDQQGAAEGPEMLIYCGITMVKPMRELADSFEQSHGCRVIMNQGGSEDLYQSLKYSRKGDLYLPGSEAYREKHLDEGILLDHVYLGFNQAALMVQKGNPRNIEGTLDCLLDRDLAVVIGNPESCSIGKQSWKILEKAGIYDQVVDNCFSLAADSRNLNKHMKDRTADVMLNWRATAFFPENQGLVDVVDLPESVSPRKKLLLNLLSFSAHPELAREFMAHASSPEGQAVFRRWGFLTDEAGAEAGTLASLN